MAKILVLHLVGQFPIAGIAFQALHHIIGLSRLGHDVYYVEDSDAPPYDPRIRSIVGNCKYGAAFINKVMKRFGMGDKWVYWDRYHKKSYGLSKKRLDELYTGADALINVCSSTHLRAEHMKCPIRIYLETDPIHPQIKFLLGDKKTQENILSHTHHFTYGENLGNSDCPIPLPPGIRWRKTRPPVVLDMWDPNFKGENRKFTTITTWRNVGEDVVFGGRKYYWSKHLNFLQFSGLPKLVDQEFEIATEATDSDDKPTFKSFKKNGWSTINPFKVSRSLDSYQKYIMNSRGEFTVAKDLVVSTRSGWFSDRSVSFLAAGKPCVLQETGFSKFIPVGKGLFSFNIMQEAIDAIETINMDYEYHCREARKVAEKYFDSDKLLKKMTSVCGI